jgi:hypothetical protein
MEDVKLSKEEAETEVSRIAAKRDQFDFDHWKDRAASEVRSAKLSPESELHQCYRRNIETLTALRKTKSAATDNTDLFTAVDKKLLEFVNGLKLITI